MMIKYPHGIMFHHFHDQRNHQPSQGSINANQFIKIIEFIGVKNILPPEVWMDKILSGTLESHNVCLSFDDNIRSQYDIALPILEKFNLKAFFFVNSAIYSGYIDKLELYRHFRENYFENLNQFYNDFFKRLYSQSEFNWIEQKIKDINFSEYKKNYIFYTFFDRKFRYVRDEILGHKDYYKFMDDWIVEYKINFNNLKEKLWFSEKNITEMYKKEHHFGLHSHSHPTKIENLNIHEQENEYIKNFNFIKNLLSFEPVSVSHPSGSYNQETLKILKNLGIKIGFMDNIQKKINTSFLEIPRENHTNLVKLIT